VRCDDLSGLMPGVAAGEVVLPAPARQHVEHCLRCQAELVQHRRVLRAMRALRHEVLEPTPGALAELLSSLEYGGERRAVRSILHRHRAAYLGGLAAATAAGAAGVALVATRSRRSRTPTPGRGAAASRGSSPRRGSGTGVGTRMAAAVPRV